MNSKSPPENNVAHDLDALYAALARSRFRSSIRLAPKDLAYLHAKGLPTVLEHAHTFLTDRLAPAQPRRDGKQTPWKGHPAFTAQHATATCCRKCLARWHHIPLDRPLTPNELNYLLAVLARWLTAQLDATTTPGH